MYMLSTEMIVLYLNNKILQAFIPELTNIN